MKRRETLKALSLSSFGLAAMPSSDLVAAPPAPKPIQKTTPGRYADELVRDAKLFAEKFFTDEELKTLNVLSDIIIPADAKSGSASQAGVPAFIEFMVKDKPEMQTPFRGGMRWLDNICVKRYGKSFVNCAKNQQIELVDAIAYPETAKPEMSQGVSFFTLMRNMTLTGFYTTQIGFNDIGYMGNTPNEWTGVPQEVLTKYGF